jgi:ABC-type bacteriocin/lantibiotic exporter with double-glycine peptidase domain
LDIRINQGNFTWNNSTDESSLKDIDLTIARGSLVLILGRVGSGKTTLLNGLLGELNKTNGTINVHQVLKNGFAYVRLIVHFLFDSILIRLFLVKNPGFNKCHFERIFYSEKYTMNNGIKK